MVHSNPVGVSVPRQSVIDLIAKLEAAEAQRPDDFSLDNEVLETLGIGLDGTVTNVERCARSLDAATALAERVLPGWYWRGGNVPLSHWHHGRYTNGWAHIQRTHADHCDRKDEATGWAETVPLALCIAILRAKLAGYEGEAEVSPIQAQSQGGGE